MRENRQSHDTATRRCDNSERTGISAFKSHCSKQKLEIETPIARNHGTGRNVSRGKLETLAMWRDAVTPPKHVHRDSDIVTISEAERGNSKAYTVSRLQKQANAAEIKAGFRKKISLPLRQSHPAAERLAKYSGRFHARLRPTRYLRRGDRRILTHHQKP
jgi:hypothetical protein